MADTYQRLRAALIRARLAQGLSQADLAAKLDEDPEFVMAYEGGSRNLLVEDLLRVAHSLRLDPAAALDAARFGELDGHATRRPPTNDAPERPRGG